MLSFTVGNRDLDLPLNSRLDVPYPIRFIDILWVLHNPHETTVIEFKNCKDNIMMSVKGHYSIDDLIQWFTDNVYEIKKITITHRNGDEGTVELKLNSNNIWHVSIVGYKESSGAYAKKDRSKLSNFAKFTYLNYKYASGLDLKGQRIFHLPFNY